MSTPSDAPYKVRQHEIERVIRDEKREVLRLDRRRLVEVAAAAAHSARQVDAEGRVSRDVLRRLFPVMTRAERARAGALAWSW